VAFGVAAGPQVCFDIRRLFFTEKKLHGSMASDIEDLQYGLQLIKEGRVKPVLDQTLPLGRAAEAHRLLATSKVTGNIVLLPWVE
jgi:NADPH2:quinone reductase